MINNVKIAPSLLSANFANLEKSVRLCEENSADILHLDIMDGHFVPNITFGPLVVSAIGRLTDLPLDCHLMITDPDKYIADFVEAGADMISVHVETGFHLHRTISTIKNYGCKAGIVLNPATPLEYAFEAAEFCDFILLMSVNPGFGGQSFMSDVVPKISEARRARDEAGYAFEIEIDGGINAKTAKICVEAGATVLAAGSSLFGSKDMRGEIESWKRY